MQLTETIIAAVAESFTAAELAEKKSEAVAAFLANPNAIVSASTGAGASYTKEISMTAQDAVELFSAALRYKNGEPPANPSQSHPVIFNRIFA